MAKVTEYPRITKMKDNDVLLVDGPDGTRTILQTNASKQMGGEVIMVNETAGESTKVVINTTGEDIELATMADLEPAVEDISDLKTQLNSSMYATQDWLADGNVEYDDDEIPVAYDIIWADGVQGRVSKSVFDSDVLEYTTVSATHGLTIVTYQFEFDANGYVISESYTIS